MTSLYETWMPAWNGVGGEVKGHAEHDIFDTAHGHMHSWLIRVELCSLCCEKRVRSQEK